MGASLDHEFELVETIGKVAAVSMAERFGGTRLYVPIVIPDDHPIVLTIGRLLADKLAARYSPDIIRVPLLKYLRIAKKRYEGLTLAEIAVAMVMTEPAIDAVMSRLRALDEPLWP